MEYDIVIIGSGVAGLTAGIYSSRANLKTLIIENSNLGGITATIDNIENYPGFNKISGFELVQNMYSQCVSFCTNFEFSTIKTIEFDKNTLYLEDKTITYKTLIIASGSSNKKLNVENENFYLGRGLSYCAVCDGRLFKDKKIVVVTDGYIGKISIDYLSNITENIIILDVVDEYKDDRFSVYNNVKIQNLNGDEYLSAIEFESVGGKQKVDCDGVFVCLGKYNDLSLYENYLDIKNNHLLTDENMRTKINNVFVAGDIREKSLRQIITACSDGAIASTQAIQYIQKK